MRIITKQWLMAEMAREMTWQDPFDTTLKCSKCGKKAKLMMLIDDDEGIVCDERPNDVKIWPHDCLAIALYLCTECGELTAVWNQG